MRGGLLNAAFAKTEFVAEVLTGANCVDKPPESHWNAGTSFSHFALSRLAFLSDKILLLKKCQSSVHICTVCQSKDLLKSYIYH